jgi:hypothetical protein
LFTDVVRETSDFSVTHGFWINGLMDWWIDGFQIMSSVGFSFSK